MDDKMKLTIEIQNNQPVALLDLAQSMLSTAGEYRSYVAKHAPDVDPTGAQLYVKEVRSGSVITELVAMAPYALPLIENADSVLEYGKYLVEALSWLMGGGERPDENFDKKSLQNFSTIIEPVARDRGSMMIFSGTTINGDLNFTFNIDSTGANAIQNSARKEMELQKEPVTGIHNQVLMYWAQARNQPNSKSGDRARIESIYRGDVKVRFANDDLKMKMLYEPDHPFEKAFVVDVAVETIDEKPMLYRVLELHETIDRE